jgi:hypothetical protein
MVWSVRGDSWSSSARVFFSPYHSNKRRERAMKRRKREREREKVNRGKGKSFLKKRVCVEEKRLKREKRVKKGRPHTAL